jgi:hypothetical protein
LTVGRYSRGGFCPRSAILSNGAPLSLPSQSYDDTESVGAYFMGLIRWEDNIVLGMYYQTCGSDDPGIVVLYRVDHSGAAQIARYYP